VATPSAGSTTTAFSVGLTGRTIATGLTYQWQKSATGAAGSFTNISGATDSTYSFTGITTNTYYRAVVSCSGAGDSSVAALVTVSSTAACNIITTIAGNGSAGYSGDGGVATAAAFNNANGVATDIFGNIYVADVLNNRIRKIAPTGIISTVAGTGTVGYSGDGGAATAATLSSPIGVACDAGGNLYIADYTNSCVRKVSTSGIITTIAGTGTPAYSGDGGPATAAALYYPYSIAVDSNNYVYISDYGNYRIRCVLPSGIINTIAGTGTYGFSGDGGAATSASISNTDGVTFDGSGNIYFSDYGNSRIRKISTSGIISTIAGTGTYGYGGDGGAATSATMSYPTGLISDIFGNLYFNDLNNNVVRKISTSGIITTVAGTTVSGFSGDGGVATAARLTGPTGLAIDGSGKLYILDNGNARLRVISGGPVVGAITGLSSVAVGSSITLSDTTAGGTWSSGSPAIASINSSGVVTGVAAGLARISYSVTGTCGTTMVTYAVTVTGASSSCSGTPTAGTAVATPSAGYETTTFNVGLTGRTVAAGLTYQWQKSAPSATGPFTNISGATDSTYSFTGVTSNTYVRCYVSCGSATDTSRVATIGYAPPSDTIWTIAGSGSSGFSGDGGAAR
jgi:sugar lactone lactonase YvrE